MGQSYEAWTQFLANKSNKFNLAKFQQRFPEQEYNRKREALTCVDFTYEVDGLTVVGYYMKPKAAADKALPVIIFNRGGNGAFGSVNFAKKMGFIADLAELGYVVIGSQYRGASRKFIENNGEDEFGGADVNDVLALESLLSDIPDADPSRIAMMGWSRGGMQSFLAAKHMPKLKTIVAIASNADARKSLAFRPDMENVYKKRVPYYAGNKDEALSARSVIDWIDELPAQAPILLVHGSADKRVNVEQSRLLAKALSEQSHQHKLVIYEEGNHGLQRHRQALIKDVKEWLSLYL
ncbi:alpha/beta hydrolase family protein [Alteromonas facilis]|uniref:alpha/beta hydrolase family protein n=1 Tax=Alteromonas facilis TaxID=2048004 RepID=UPI0013DCB4D7|nr:prolyl oligopeptidase family serine peptidase [Alteromonas facilis]